MSKLQKIVKDFLIDLLLNKSVPIAVRKHLASEMKLKGAREMAVRQQIAIVKDKNKTAAERKAALSILINFHRGEA